MTALQPMNWENNFGFLKSSLDRRVSCPITEQENEESPRLQRTQRLNSTPTFNSGIPLGSLTAQLASKSFWSPEMLMKSMEEIAQCAAQESSSLGSSLESVQSSDDNLFEGDTVQVSDKESEEGSSSSSAPLLQQHTFVLTEEKSKTEEKRELRKTKEKREFRKTEEKRAFRMTKENNAFRKRELKHPLEKTRSSDSSDPTARRSGISTPPYLSPGVTRRVQLNIVHVPRTLS